MPNSPATHLKACINGARTPDQHPNLPVTPGQIAAAALAAHQAGAKAVHMHSKTADGVDSLQPEVVAAAVESVRHAVPGLPLGVTTGFWALSDPDERLRTVQGWTVLPDFASVNWHEPGSEPLARQLLQTGVGVEVGIFHAEAAAGSPAPVLLHGFNESCWPLLQHAGARGLQTRIGMEDTLVLPDGSPAPDNAALVSAAVQLLSR
jgi:uncharacterized protein (DUF849 family)